MVYVTHYGNDRGSWLHILRLILYSLLFDGLLDFSGNELDLVTEIFSHEGKGVGIQSLVDGNHKAEVHAGADDLCHRLGYHHSQIVDRNKLGDLQDIALETSSLDLFLSLFLGDFSLFPSVLGSLGLSLSFNHPLVGLLDLLLNFVLVHLVTDRLESFLSLLVLSLLGGLAVLVALLAYINLLLGVLLDPFSLSTALFLWALELGKVYPLASVLRALELLDLSLDEVAWGFIFLLRLNRFRSFLLFLLLNRLLFFLHIFLLGFFLLLGRSLRSFLLLLFRSLFLCSRFRCFFLLRLCRLFLLLLAGNLVQVYLAYDSRSLRSFNGSFYEIVLRLFFLFQLVCLLVAF